MNPAIAPLVALFWISAMLSAILAIAWGSFGRPRHALVWSVAFALAALQWLGNMVYLLVAPGQPAWLWPVSTLAIFTYALVALGFGLRSGWQVMAKPLFAVAAAASLAVAIAAFLPHSGIRNALPPLFGALTLALAAGSVQRPGLPVNLAERSAIVALVLFCALDLWLGVIALMQGAAGNAFYAEYYRTLALLGLPAAFTGVGLFAVFLLAADLAEDMRRLALSDPLTGVLNRRGFEQAAARAIAVAKRYHQPLTVVLADLDRFKSINDRFGHAAGDTALQRFAGHVQQAIRSGDILGRMGGEEFALVLIGSSAAAAADVINRLRVEVSELALDAGQLTSSFGLTELREDDVGLAQMLVRADHALYQSKQGGRNRVTIADAGAATITEIEASPA